MTIWCKTPEVLDALITLRALVPGRAEVSDGAQDGAPYLAVPTSPQERHGSNV